MRAAGPLDPCGSCRPSVQPVQRRAGSGSEVTRLHFSCFPAPAGDGRRWRELESFRKAHEMSRGEDGGQTAGVFHVEGAWREEDRTMEDGAASHSHARAKLPQAWLTNLLTQPIIISVLHTPPRTLQPQGLCTCRAPCLECSFSAPPPPSVSVRLAPWLSHPTPSPSECSPACHCSFSAWP